MHCYIKLNILGEFYTFRIRKLDRTKLYGHKEVVAKCGDEECKKAYINENGMIRLTNGCTKFFDTKEKAKKPYWKKNVDASFSGLLNRGHCFQIGESNRKCFKEKPESFLNRSVIDAYELTNPDENLTQQVKKLLGKEIWRVIVVIQSESEYCCEKEISVRFFANEKGIFATVNKNNWINFIYEDLAVKYDYDNEVIGEEVEIDFENLW